MARPDLLRTRFFAFQSGHGIAAVFYAAAFRGFLAYCDTLPSHPARPLKRGQQWGGSSWKCDIAAKNLCGGYVAAVKVRICTGPGGDHRTFKRGTYKKAPALAVSVNRREWRDSKFRRPSNRSDRHTHVTAQGDIGAPCKSVNGVLSI